MPTKRTPPVATAGAVAAGKTPKKGKVGAADPAAAAEVKKGEAKTTAVKMKAAGGVDTTTKKKKPTKPSYDPRAVSKLAAEHPDAYWVFHATSNHGMIDDINDDNPLELVPVDVSDQGPIISMTLSPDGTLLATFCTLGSAKLWDVTPGFRLVRKLRDAAEENIDEFYCGRFAPDQAHLLVGGKLKDRKRWSAEDEDNHILPCPLKIFGVDTGVVVSTLHGHSEEILCVKALQFKGDNYYITTSQDGYIFKWRMDDDWTTLISSTRMEDGITCMAFTVSFVPDTGNKYFMAACDEHLRLYDFEDAVLLQTFEDMYSSYCDCGKFIRWSDADAFASLTLGTGDGDDKENERQEKEELVDVEAHEDDTKRGHGKTIGRKKAGSAAGAASKSAWFISRGVELCDLEEGLLPSAPNTCTLHRLVYPEKKGAPFRLDVVRKYKHADYFANSWLVKIASNGRYILAPTPYGQVFVYNIGTGEVTAMLKDHEDLEVRDVLFHPYRPLVFTCGDGELGIFVPSPDRIRMSFAVTPSTSVFLVSPPPFSL
ncbi:WD40-repeat-containing domain protein [Jimgerdemannia flammicorona]|uniref:WD40-repeat-containing domain protein n=1 Tax=Jimgerdemannia flammicorona TaxID=994334 RepID=A0A433QF85_9FUNG|nr:WD40-repeat-containing domain protein [Jimgerdemannia flammicorona]